MYSAKVGKIADDEIESLSDIFKSRTVSSYSASPVPKSKASAPNSSPGSGTCSGNLWKFTERGFSLRGEKFP